MSLLFFMNKCDISKTNIKYKAKVATSFNCTHPKHLEDMWSKLKCALKTENAQRRLNIVHNSEEMVLVLS